MKRAPLLSAALAVLAAAHYIKAIPTPLALPAKKAKGRARRVTMVGNWREFQHRRHARRNLGLAGEPFPAANIGRCHPDYGMTPGEHVAAKARRAA